MTIELTVAELADVTELDLVATVLDPVRRDDDGVQYRVALRVEIRGQERPAMVGESIYLTYAG
jgi:hypothetical protein